MRLLRATIDDFGLIAHAEVEFSAGLTVFSGETGSGKSTTAHAVVSDEAVWSDGLPFDLTRVSCR